ncbi:MAG TPA: IclR family transcriptional regulator [Trebonia sp.]|nr:IclR family transcriptional regulator [Trebonia sp.]
MIPVRVAEDATGQKGMQTLVRALRILHELSRHSSGMGLQDLAINLDIPLASTHRLIGALASEGYIVRSPHTKRCFIGPAAEELGVAARRNQRLMHLPPAALARAATVAGETAFITEMIDGRAVCVSIVTRRGPFRLSARLGAEMPLHAAASARSLLVDHDEEELSATLGVRQLEVFRPRTPRSVQEVAARLEIIRSQGYDTCEDELDEAVVAVSAPIRDERGRVRWSVTIAAPKVRLRRKAAWGLSVAVLREAATELAHDLA